VLDQLIETLFALAFVGIIAVSVLSTLLLVWGVVRLFEWLFL